ncbi:MAG: hypothetical protein IKS25_01725 [Oscillospiraceae bacterium]|nr:hypothetical protein [Oscillospiraceae bacterium]
MKHPALARVFSVVLAILCLLMLVNGVKGFGKADAEAAERAAFSEKYAQRIETYRQLDEELANSISYEEAYQELEKLQEQHDADASQHRTDVAMYSAEKGGYTMGADMIWEAMPAVKGAKRELEIGKAQLAAMETAYAGQKGEIASITAAAGNGAAACRNANGAMKTALNNLGALMASPVLPPPEDPGDPGPEPPLPDPLEWTEEPVVKPDLEDPGSFTEQMEEPSPDSYEDEADYLAAVQSYQDYLARKQAHEDAVAAYNSAMQPYWDYENRYAAWNSVKQAHDAWSAAAEAKQQYDDNIDDLTAAYQRYQGELEAAQGACAMAAGQAGAVLQSQAGELAALAGRAGAVAEAMGVSMPSDGQIPGGISMDPESGADIMQTIQKLQAGLSAMESGFSQIAGGLSGIEGQITAARSKVNEGEKQLKEAEGQLQGQLENIWYKLGELEKDKAELETEKTELDEEAAAFNKRLVETEELKRLKNRRISTRQILISVSEVKAREAETGDLAASAEEYLKSYRQESETLLRGRRLINLLAVIGGAAGVLGIPAAFEKLRKRFFLVTPVLLCLACAVGADALNLRLGLGQMYTALFTAIFALIQLLIVLPKNRLPAA